MKRRRCLPFGSVGPKTLLHWWWASSMGVELVVGYVLTPPLRFVLSLVGVIHLLNSLTVKQQLGLSRNSNKLMTVDDCCP